MLQAFNSSSGLVMRGSASILSGLQVYQAKEWVLRSWRDVFVDLVQGQLQFLFLSLLTGGLLCTLCAMLDLVLLANALTNGHHLCVVMCSHPPDDMPLHVPFTADMRVATHICYVLCLTLFSLLAHRLRMVMCFHLPHDMLLHVGAEAQ